MPRSKKPTKWGTPRNEQTDRIGSWELWTREFVCTDGTSFYQYKVVRSGASGRVGGLYDALASVVGWVSKPPRKNRAPEFATREEARIAGLDAVKACIECLGT